ncbi:MAG: hypothetical protein KDK70_36160, partial [Myxococcales bacterium]|nr:hypothetical protein [Myxococcales bacterium]
MLGTLLGAALAVSAAPSGEASVSWEVPERAGCPDGAAVRRRIEALLRRALVDGEVHVEGTVQHAADGFTLRLRVRSGEVVDERTLEAERCEALAETAALVAAVMVDPEVAESLRVPEPEVPVPDEPEPEPPEELEPEPAPEPEPDPPE